jgi:hypothetical protein
MTRPTAAEINGWFLMFELLFILIIEKKRSPMALQKNIKNTREKP